MESSANMEPETSQTGRPNVPQSSQEADSTQTSTITKLEGDSSSALGQSADLGEFFTSILVTIYAQRSEVLRKKLVEIYEHDSFRTLCMRVLDAQTAARLGEHYKIQVSFLLGEEWIAVSRAEQPVKATLTRFPDTRHLKLQLASISAPGYVALRPLNQPRRERLFKIVGFLVKGILLYEVAALVTNVVLSVLGKMPEPEDPEDELDAVLRAMDTEQLLEVQKRAKDELKKLQPARSRSQSVPLQQGPMLAKQEKGVVEKMPVPEDEPWVSSGPEGDDEANAISGLLAGVDRGGK